MSRQAQQQQMIPVVRSQPQQSQQPQPSKTVRAAAWSSPPASYSARDAAMQGAAGDPGAPTSVRFHYGRNRVALILSNALTPDDLQHILRSVFALGEPVVGVFEPERQVIFPFSLLTKCPAVFTAEYYLVLERSGVAVPEAAAGPSERREAVLIDSDYSASPSMSPASSSAYSSPAASPLRPQGRKQLQAQAQAPSQVLQPYDRAMAQRAQQQRQQQQQQQQRPSGAQQAYSKAQALARLAESSPVASSPDASASEESDVNSSFDEAEGDSQFSDYSERSDQKRDLAAEAAEFDRAVVRAMEAEKRGQSPFKKPQPRATTAPPSRGQQQARAAVNRAQQQQQQQQQQSEAAEIALQERLLSELGGYDSNGQDGGVDGDAAEALRQEFWQRERERHWIEAESKVLAAEAQKLAQQRQHIAELKKQQAALQAEQAVALAAVQAAQQQQQAASRAAAQAAASKVHAATALKSAINGRASNARASDYNTFEPSDASELEDSEEEQEYGGSEVEQSAEESEDAGEEPVYPASHFPESFGLDARELQELDRLQQSAGFASVSPAQLLHLFARRVDAHGNLTRDQFDQATREFILIAHGSSNSATAASGREKADLVLRRLFDLFKEDASTGSPSYVPFASFATGLSILCQGDRDSKMLLALAQFDPAKSGYLSLDALAAYLAAFFTVVLDLSVSLQSSVLRSVDLDELSYATAAKCWNDLGVDPSQPISFVQFRDLHLGAGTGAANEGQAQQSEEDEDDEEEEQDEDEEEEQSEDDAEAEEREAADARMWLQRLRAQQQQQAASSSQPQQRQQPKQNGASNGQRAAPSQQQERPIRPRL